MANTDPRIAALSSAILLGESGLALHFFQKSQQQYPAEVREQIAEILAKLAGMSTDASVVYQLDELALSTNTATPHVSQISNGETQATSYFSWLLHGSPSTKIYCGYCDTNGTCATLGSETADLEANTYFPSDGAHWYMDVTYASGSKPYMQSNVEHIRQDRTGQSDVTKSTLNCPSSGSFLSCSGDSNPSMTTDNWYYFSADWVNVVGSYPPDAVSLQTRRWKVLNSSNWQFLAYGNGG